MSGHEHTTMYNIAEQLWHSDSHNLYIGPDSAYHWDNLGERERRVWYNKAVRIIDTAEPIWRSRIGTEYEYGCRILTPADGEGEEEVTWVAYPEETARMLAALDDDFTLIRRIKTKWEEV